MPIPRCSRKFPRSVAEPIDGHAPGVRGLALNAYIAAGIGSDHESVTVEEAREKLARGMYVLNRDASNAHNLAALLPLINDKNARRICFCTDDRQPADLLTQGGIDYMLRRAIEKGIDPITAFRCCTLNSAEWFGLNWLGAIAPGRCANLFTFEDLQKPVARQVYFRGRPVDRQSTPNRGCTNPPDSFRQSCRADLSKLKFQIPSRPGKIRVIGSRENQLITDHRILDPKIHDGEAIADPSRDILKMAGHRAAQSHRSGSGWASSRALV